MNGKSMSLANVRAGRFSLFFAFGCATLIASGCVTYRAHIQVTPDGKLEITERAEAQPGMMDTLHVDPRLAWTAFQATVEGRGGHFEKDRPDSLKGATGRYELDNWVEFGQRGQAFKGMDEGERRLRAANAQSEVKDQYFYKDTTLGYKLELSEPDNATVDSLALPYAERATGVLEIEVPGTILKHNAPKKAGNLLSWPLAYGQTVDAEVSFREWQWVSMVSVVLVAIFLGYLLLSGIKHLSKKGKKQPAV
jgi:hypothetical protein